MTTKELGEVKREFKPGLDNLVAGIVIGLLMIGGGSGLIYLAARGVMRSEGNLPFWDEEGHKGWSWSGAGGLVVVSLGLIIGGMFLIRWMRSLFSLRLCVADRGFSVSNGNPPRIIGWDDIVSVQETHLYERPPVVTGLAKYAMPKMKSISFVITVEHGSPIAFDANSIKGHLRLAEMIKEETDRRSIPWAIIEQQG